MYVEPTLLFNYTYPVYAPLFHYVPNRFQFRANDTPSIYSPVDTTSGGPTKFPGTNWTLTFDNGDSQYQSAGAAGIGNATLHGGTYDMIAWNYTGQNAYVWRETDDPTPSDLVLMVDGNYVRGTNMQAFNANSQWNTKQNYTSHRVSFGMLMAKDMTLDVHAITLTQGLVTNASTMDDVYIYSDQFVVDGQLNPNFDWTANGGSGGRTAQKVGWEVSTTLEAAVNNSNSSPQPPINYTSAALNWNQENLTAQVSVNIPHNTSYAIVHGSLGSGWGRWAFTFNQPIPWPVPPQDTGVLLESDNFTVFVDADFMYNIADVPFLTVPLDPTLQYNLVINQAYNATAMGHLSSLTYYSAIANSSQTDTSGTSSPNAPAANSASLQLSKGAIAGAVVGGIIGAIAIAAASWYLGAYCRSRRRRKMSQADPATFEIDHNVEATPFTDNGGYSDVSTSVTGGTSKNARTSSEPEYRTRQPIIEEDADDAGIMGDDGLERLPPIYQPRWANAKATAGDNLLHGPTGDDWSSMAGSSVVESTSGAPLMRESTRTGVTGVDYSTTASTRSTDPRYSDAKDEVLGLPLPPGAAAPEGGDGPLMFTPMMFGPDGASKPPRGE